MSWMSLSFSYFLSLFFFSVLFNPSFLQQIFPYSVALSSNSTDNFIKLPKRWWQMDTLLSLMASQELVSVTEGSESICISKTKTGYSYIWKVRIRLEEERSICPWDIFVCHLFVLTILISTNKYIFTVYGGALSKMLAWPDHFSFIKSREYYDWQSISPHRMSRSMIGQASGEDTITIRFKKKPPIFSHLFTLKRKKKLRNKSQQR